MNAVLPLARRLLSKNHEFYPLGATMSASGKIALTAGWTGDEHPKSADVIAILEDGFRAGDAEGKFKATALVVDMRVVPPGESEKRDAVAVNLDHRDGYSVRVVFPYSFSNAGELLFERPFTLAGEKRIFSR